MTALVQVWIYGWGAGGMPHPKPPSSLSGIVTSIGYLVNIQQVWNGMRLPEAPSHLPTLLNIYHYKKVIS